MSELYDQEPPESKRPGNSGDTETGHIGRKKLGRLATVGIVFVSSVLAGAGILNHQSNERDERRDQATENTLAYYGWPPETIEVHGGGSELVLKCADPQIKETRSISIINDPLDPELRAELVTETRDKKGELFTSEAQPINLVSQRVKIQQMMFEVCNG